jgi:sn-glycerol 3-phosphate transport system permease protein
MKRGGPDNATSLLLFYSYRIGFRFLDTAQASAATVILLVILAAAAALQFLFLERRTHYR